MTGGTLVVAGTGLRSRRRLGVAATSAVLVLAAMGIAAGLVVSRQGAPLLDAVADDADVAHLVVYGDPAAIETVAADQEVLAWSGPFATLDAIALLGDGDEVAMQLTALDDPDVEVNRPPVRSGRWAAAPDEIVLDHSVAADLGIDLDDTVPFRLAATSATFDVVGTAVSFTDCFYPQCDPGRAWVTTAGLAALEPGDAVYAQGWLRFDDPAQADPFVERQAASGVAGIGGTESWLDTRDDFLSFDRIFGAFVAAFGVFVLAVAAVVVAGSTAMRVVARRREIGLLGAVGCTPRQVTSAFLLENLALGAVAGLVGWFLAGFLAPSLQLGIGQTLGPQDPSWPVLGLVVAEVAIALLMAAATIVPALAAARRPVTDVLRDVPRDRVSWLNRRAARLPSRLPLLGAREVAAQPTRGALAALAIAVAVVGTLVSIGFVGGVDAVASDPARAGDPWDVAVVPGDLTAGEVDAALTATSGVGSWFGEVARRSTLDEGAFLSVATGGDPDAAGYHIVEGRAMASAGEAIAGYGFLERFDVSVGDEIELLAGTAPVTVEVVGWYRETEDSGEVLRYRIESLVDVEPGVAPDVYRITAADGVAATALAAALAARLGPSARIEVLDTGVEDLAPLTIALRLIAVVLLAMAASNLLSTLLTADREAAGRVGVQIAVGFTPRQVIVQGAVAGAVLGVVAAVFGVPIGLWTFRVLSDAVSSAVGVGPGWMPAPGVAAVAVLVVAAVALSAALGAFAASRITRRATSELVRGE